MLLVIAASVWLAFAQFTPPGVVPASAPATEFSAERAMTDLWVIAKVPHPMVSPASAEVRAYLIKQITAMGLQPEVQTTTIVSRWPGGENFHTGTVKNVIVRLKGTASTHAILLDAHYDAANTGPGASDEGSGIVTLLETMRALKASPPLKNDVIFVFADGEEYGDLGAHAFAEQHPWMQEVGLAINFEAQGSGGPAYLYDTSQQNGWLINEFLKAAPYPLVSPWVDLIKAFPSQQLGCDLEAYMARGSGGLDFVYTADSPAYHTMRDNVQVIDPRSIQQEGSYALALVRHFGTMDLSQIPTASDEVFFNILPGVVVHYSQTWAVPLAVLTVLLFLGVLALGFRRKRLTVGGFALGTLIFLLSLIGTVMLLILLWWALKAVNPNYQVFMVGYYGIDLAVLGLAALAIAVMSTLFLWLRTRMLLDNLAAGALVWWAILMVLSSLFLPGASYLFTWPLLCSLLTLGWLFLTKEPAARRWLHAAVLSIAVVPSIVLLTAATIFLMALTNRFDALLGIPGAPIPSLFVVLLTGLLIPQLALLSGEPHKPSAALTNPEKHPMVAKSTESHPAFNAGKRLGTCLKHWLVPISALLISIILLSAAIATSGFSATHPGTDRITYQLNADTGQAVWLSSDQRLDNWTRQFFPTSSGPGPFQAKAPTVALPAPTVTRLSDTMNGSVRTLRVQVASPRHAAYVNVQVEAQGEIVAATLDGKPLDLRGLAQNTGLRLQYVALPDKGFELTLSIASAAPVKITVQDISDGLPTIPGMTIQPRPVYLMPAPTWRDPTIVIKSFMFAR